MAAYTDAGRASIVGADPDVEGVLAQMDGANGSAGTNSARMMMIKLKPLSERKLDAGRRSSAACAPSCRAFPASMSS